MGITCKHFGKMRSILRKVENDELKEKNAAKVKKNDKKNQKGE